MSLGLWLPILLLIVLAGIIAYAGDRLGTYFGKNRLSLFGLRPKRTGQFIGVLAGVLIMLSTLGASALIFKDATNVIFRAEKAAEELNALRVETKALENAINKSNTELAAAQATIAQALEQRSNAEQERDTLKAETITLQQDVGNLRSASIIANSSLEKVNDELATAKDQLDIATQSLIQVESALLSAQAERDKAVTDASIAREEAINLAKQVSDMRLSLDKSNSELFDLHTQLASKFTELQDVRNQLISTEAAVNTRSQELDSVRLELENVQQQLSAATEEVDFQRNYSAILRSKGYQTAIQNDVLKTQRLLDIDRLNSIIISLNTQVNNLHTQSDAIMAQNSILELANVDLKENNRGLQSNIDALNAQVASLNAQSQQLRAELNDSSVALSQAQSELNVIRARALTFSAGEVLSQKVITSQEESDILAQLSEMLIEANDLALVRGAGELSVNNNQIDAFIDLVKSSPSADVAIIRSSMNQFGHNNVQVELLAEDNRLLVDAGELITSRTLVLNDSLSQSDLQGELSRLGIEAQKQLIAQGLKGEAALSDINSFLSNLPKLSGEVIIGVKSTAAIYVGSESALELVVLR